MDRQPARSRTTHWSNGCAPSRARVHAVLDRRNAVVSPRPQRGAAHRRVGGAGALPRREGAARPARLRRPDRQDAGAARKASTPPGCTTSSTLGIDHVLIDEAQDTSAKQWEIIQRLVGRIHRRQGRPRAQRARSSPSATRSSRSSRFRTRRPRSSRRCGGYFEGAHQGRRIGFSFRKFEHLVPFRRERARRRR